MRNVVNQLGRVVSVVTVVVLLTAPTTKGASFLLDRDGDSGPILGPANRIVHLLKKWFASRIGDDELIIPRP
jgi:hypothetical protein